MQFSKTYENYEGISVMRKKDILPFPTTWIDPEDIMLREMSQAEKEKYCYDITCIWNLKKPNL